MKFKFTLEAVKKHRKILKGLAQREFEQAKMAVDLKNEQINMMYEAIDEARLEAENIQLQENAKAGPLLQIEDFIIGQNIRIHKARLEVRELMAALEEKQEALVEKVKELKIIERLEEKQNETFKKEVNKKLQIEADDMTIMRFEKLNKGDI